MTLTPEQVEALAASIPRVTVAAVDGQYTWVDPWGRRHFRPTSLPPLPALHHEAPRPQLDNFEPKRVVSARLICLLPPPEED